MQYIAREPAPPLSDFVLKIWESTYTPSHSRVRILPSGTTELVVNLSADEIRVYDSVPPQRLRRFPGIVIAGAYSGALEIDPMRHASMLGVRFKPGGAFPFLGEAIGELTNSHLALEALWGAAACELRERLCAAATSRRRFQIVVETLLARLQPKTHHPAVLLALDLFQPATAAHSVRAVARRVDLSERRLIQLFTAQVGLTPKRFSRIMRFQHVRDLISRSAMPDWAQLAQICGYYDQSHLVRDFQQLGGLRPTDYLGRRGSALFSNLVI